MAAWNFMQLELTPADLMIRPMVGPGSLDRAGALAEIQSILDRGAAEHGGPFLELAAKWKRGAKDDTLYLGALTWTVYEYTEADLRAGALAWIEDYAATIRKAGVNVQMPKLP